MKGRAFSIIALLVAVLVLAQTTSANVDGTILRVGTCPQCDYTSIQDAVNDAVPGDKILVYPGFYFETVTVHTDDLRILAQGPGVEVAADTDIACFDVHADYVVIRGFDLTGPSLASGIQFEGSHNIFADNTIHDLAGFGVNALVCRDLDGGSDFNRILNNTVSGADLGIVVVGDTTDAVNRGNIIAGNVISDMGQTPIVVENGVGFTVSGNRIIGAGTGSCIAIGALEENYIAQGRHRIVENEMVGCALNGIDLYSFDAPFDGNLISGNEISFASCGINIDSDSGASMSANLISSNHAYQNLGGGICLGYGAHNNRLFANDAGNNMGDGIIIQGDNNRLAGNTASDNDQYGIFVIGDDNRIVENTALGNGSFDLVDFGTDNRWRGNTYETRNW